MSISLHTATRIWHVRWLPTLLGFVLVACGGQATPVVEPKDSNLSTPTEQSTPIELVTIDLDAVPPVDTSRHTVPIEEVYFDTFRRVNRVVPLSEASDELIVSLRDAIPPIYRPKFESAIETEPWLDDSEIVLGYADGDEAIAYPIKILNWHEMVSHHVNGKPILATY